ncbi:MAG TPA: MFS transporter [Terriglobales bacterium]|nr:MFS transporter [Terriglobales bacterium]
MSAAALLSVSSAAQRRTLLAAALGWMLDAFDVMLYAMVLAHIMRDLGMSKGTAGLLNTLTLLASGLGGLLFGFIADRVGRRSALMLSILTYSIFSFACGLATSILMLASFRFILGLGMGGEWNTGATLVAETWPTELRSRALAVVQSSWAIGYAAAALVSGIVLHYYNWRVVFFVGILPALITLWIRKDVPESELWARHRTTANLGGAIQSLLPSSLFSSQYWSRTLALLSLNLFGLFGWWGLFSWIPPYLSLPVSQGGRGFGLLGTTGLLIFLNLVGMLPGYLCYGWLAEKLGRKKSFLLFFLGAALTIPLYAAATNPPLIMILGAIVAFFGTGFFSGSGLVGSELFPTEIRARALGFTYNGARTLSALAPFIIGRVGQAKGLGPAFYLCALSFLLAAIASQFLPETKGTSLS